MLTALRRINSHDGFRQVFVPFEWRVFLEVDLLVVTTASTCRKSNISRRDRASAEVTEIVAKKTVRFV